MRCPSCQRDRPPGTARCPDDGAVLYDSVGELLRKGPVPLAQAVKIFLALADQLEERHRLGLPSGLIAPETVYALQSGAEVKVLLADEPGAAQRVPKSHRPPELLRGGSASVAGDVYSLGALVHHMISGRAAFLGASDAETEQAVLRAVPPSLGTLRLQDVPEALDLLLGRTLAKEPGRRPPSVRELIERVENMELDSTILGVRLTRAARQMARGADDAMDAPTVEATALEMGFEAPIVRTPKPRGIPPPAAAPKPASPVPAAIPDARTQLVVDPYGDTFIRSRSSLEDDGLSETLIRPPLVELAPVSSAARPPTPSTPRAEALSPAEPPATPRGSAAPLMLVIAAGILVGVALGAVLYFLR